MSITNETRFIEWHETCKCECGLDAIGCRWIHINEQCKRFNKLGVESDFVLYMIPIFFDILFSIILTRFFQ